MKITSLISASALVLAFAAPLYAQTATSGIPAALVDEPAIQQVNAQLIAQGYTITDVVKNADGSLTILSTDASGILRLITIDTATGAVADTVDGGIPGGTTGVSTEGTLEHEANESGAMEALESDGGNEGNERGHGGGNDSDGGTEGNHGGGNDSDGGNEGNHGGGNEGGNDSDD